MKTLRLKEETCYFYMLHTTKSNALKAGLYLRKIQGVFNRKMHDDFDCKGGDTKTK